MYLFTFIIIGFFAISLGIGHLLRRREMGKKAAAIEFRNLFIFFGVGVFVIIGMALLRLFPSSWIYPTFFLTLIVAYLTYFVFWLRRKRQAGSVLLDLGRSKFHKTSIITGIIFMLLGIIWLVPELLKLLIESNSETDIVFICVGLFALLLGMVQFFMGLSHFEIRESGIFYIDIAKKWERIKSYKWDGFILILRFRQLFPFAKTRNLPIPAQHKDTVEKLLAQYVQGDKNSI